MRKILASAVAATFFQAAAAQTCDDIRQYRIFFGNGIHTPSYEDAVQARDALEIAVGPSFHGDTIVYDLAYNRSENDLKDTGQSLGQLLEILEKHPDRAFTWSKKIAGPDLQTHVRSYIDALKRGERVLSVGHSQGTLYSNQAKVLLAKRVSRKLMDSFGVFGIATPADRRV